LYTWHTFGENEGGYSPLPGRACLENSGGWGGFSLHSFTHTLIDPASSPKPQATASATASENFDSPVTNDQ